jgi:hypothetical protein
MLDRLRPEVHAVRADIKGLALGRRFDYVVLGAGGRAARLVPRVNHVLAELRIDPR